MSHRFPRAPFSFSLDPVYAQFYSIRLIVAVLMIVIDLYSVGLWTYAWMRFGSLSCLLLAIASVGALFVALVAAAFSLNLAGIKRFDSTNLVYGFSYFVLQPSVALAAVIGQTLFVMWVVRNRGKHSEGI
jgi:hypothetical protein